MKIVHVCITGPWGEQYAYQENLLPHYHRAMGHEVTILAPVYSTMGYGEEGIKQPGMSILDDGIVLVRLAPLIKSILIDSHLHLVRGMKDAIIKEQPDFIFVHDVCSLNFLSLIDVKKRFPETKIVFDNHGDYVNSLHSPITKFLHKFVYRLFLAPRLVKVAGWFYGVTPSRCTFLHEIYSIPEEKIKLLVMGADDEKMELNRREELRQSVRAQYHVGAEDFLVVTGGKIDKLKNIHVLAHAVNALENKNVKLLVFGTVSPEIQPVFDEEVSSRVFTIGWVDSHKVYEYFYAADLVVFPGLHSVLWEQAVASKVPCAFSKIDGFEHVQVNGNCILMEEKSVEYYGSMIKALLENRDFYHRLKTSAESPLMEQFYYSNISRQVLFDIGLIS